MRATCSGRATRRAWRSTASRRWSWRPRAAPDLVVLDLMLPRPRRPGGDAPHPRAGGPARRAIILLTAQGRGVRPRRRPAARRRRLRRQAVLARPSSSRASTRCCGASTRSPRGEPPLRFGGLVDRPGRAARAASTARRSSLTQREFDLLLFLARHPGQAFTRNQLMDHVWRYSFYTDTSTVTVHIRRLRAKLEATRSTRAGSRRCGASATASRRETAGRAAWGSRSPPPRWWRRGAGRLRTRRGAGDARRSWRRWGAPRCSSPHALVAGARARRQPAPPVRRRSPWWRWCSSRRPSCCSSSRCSSPATTRSSPSSPRPTPRRWPRGRCTSWGAARSTTSTRCARRSRRGRGRRDVRTGVARSRRARPPRGRRRRHGGATRRRGARPARAVRRRLARPAHADHRPAAARQRDRRRPRRRRGPPRLRGAHGHARARAGRADRRPLRAHAAGERRADLDDGAGAARRSCSTRRSRRCVRPPTPRRWPCARSSHRRSPQPTATRSSSSACCST